MHGSSLRLLEGWSREAQPLQRDPVSAGKSGPSWGKAPHEGLGGEPGKVEARYRQPKSHSRGLNNYPYYGPVVHYSYSSTCRRYSGSRIDGAECQCEIDA